MSEPNITTDEAARCLAILESAAEPMTAALLAARLYLSGSRETQRRHVRALIKHLRDKCGSHIIATLWGGYLLTDDMQIWRDYINGRQIDAKRILAVTHKRKRILAGNDQGVLFDNRIRCGVATCGSGLG